MVVDLHALKLKKDNALELHDNRLFISVGFLLTELSIS